MEIMKLLYTLEKRKEKYPKEFVNIIFKIQTHHSYKNMCINYRSNS